MTRPAIVVRDVWKVYPDGTVALRGVSLEIDEGEIHGVLGENGAGKTTLMRIIYGEIKPTRGEIEVFGKKVRFRGPWDAMRMGIAMVYQRFTLVPTMSVLENLFLALSSVERGARISDARSLAEETMERTGLRVPLDARVEELPVGLQQRVEILKALMRRARVLILDEPTSVLSPLEVEALFSTLRKLKEMGITIVFITHKLKEVKEVTDRVTVLRRGRVVGSAVTSEVSEVDLARMMVGREVLMKVRRAESREHAKPILVVKDLWVRDDRGLPAVKGVSLEVREGEVLGIAGVQGNGQRELVEAIAGVRPVEKGRIEINGIDVTSASTEERYRLGLAYVPESRDIGLVLDMSVAENSVLTRVREVSRAGLLSMRRILEIASEVVRTFAVVTPSLSTSVRYLSGGNQQKLMVGRELAKRPRVLVVSEPTHGLDVAATEFVRRTIVSFAEGGGAVLLVSSDLEEVMQLSSRVAIMSGGRILAIKKPSEYSLEELGLLMGGAVA
ncbi:MAG: ABC transporter ATP-binding protein [Crenarchaeota archaeon]|nr:ABC transporter ATP-binding protein [Thermoproteota archaeon]